MPTFLHTADWQIGRQFSTFDPEDAHPLADARVQAVRRLAELAVTHQVDAVLVAGDVFDMQAVSERTIRRLFAAMAPFSGPWVLISGNHDAALADSVWTQAQRLGVVPPHVHLALRPEPLLLPEAGLAVLPAPLTQRHTYEDTTAWFDATETPTGLLRIGLAHGSVQGILAEGIDATNPIAPERVARAHLDYLALGDWHGCKRIDARTWYSGTPEPDRFKANEAGHALLVRIAAPGAEPEVTVLDTAQFNWQLWQRALQVPSDLDALLADLASLPSHTVLSLSVQGELALADHQRLQEALGQARARLRHLQAELGELRLQPTDDDIASLRADGYLADLLAELRAEQAGQGDEADTAREALALLTTALRQRNPVAAAHPSVLSAQEGAPQ
jgi:DNA repair exonuclease SbcCD nuclease subunit